MATRFSNDIRQAGGVVDGEYIGQTRGYRAQQLGGKLRALVSRFTTAVVVSAGATPWLNGEPLLLLPLTMGQFTSLGGEITLSATLGAARTASVGTFARNAGGVIVAVDAARYGAALGLTVTTPIAFGTTTALRFLAEETLGAETWLGLVLGGGDAANGVDVRVIFRYIQD